MRGTLGPQMSTSSKPTSMLRAEKPKASCAETVLLTTPPLPHHAAGIPVWESEDYQNIPLGAPSFALDPINLMMHVGAQKGSSDIREWDDMISLLSLRSESYTRTPSIIVHQVELASS